MVLLMILSALVLSWEPVSPQFVGVGGLFVFRWLDTPSQSAYSALTVPLQGSSGDTVCLSHLCQSGGWCSAPFFLL